MTQEERDQRDANEKRLAETARGQVMLLGQFWRDQQKFKPRLRRCRACGSALEEEVRCGCGKADA